jgi:hypothetical protein
MHIRQAPAIHSAKITRALTMRARDTAIYRSPRRSIILALLAGIAACVSIPFLTADDMSVQIAGAVWLGLCASVLCGLLEDALQDRPIIRINGRGILDTRVLPRPIEWWEIEFFYPVNVGRSQVIELRLRHPRRTLSDAPWYLRLGLGLNLPHVCISLLLLDGSVTQVISAIRRHAPHLVPRAREI